MAYRKSWGFNISWKKEIEFHDSEFEVLRLEGVMGITIVSKSICDEHDYRIVHKSTNRIVDSSDDKEKIKKYWKQLVKKNTNLIREYGNFKSPGGEFVLYHNRILSEQEHAVREKSGWQTVWYGTCRKPANFEEEEKFFSNSLDTKLHVGVCQVEIPQGSVFGSVDSSGINFLFPPRSSRVQINYFAEISHMDELLQYMKASMLLLEDNEQEILLVIHGYNNSFEDIIRRAGQLGFDMAYPGLLACYSWHSAGSGLEYVADGERVTQGANLCLEFIRKLVENSGARRVNIIAHSMGNRLLLNLLPFFQRENIRLGQVVMAAPDVSENSFEGAFPYFNVVAENVTVYCSDSDKALMFSSILNRIGRIGSNVSTNLSLPSNVNIVNCPMDLMTRYLYTNHTYFAEDRNVVEDLFQVVNRRTIERRSQLGPQMYQLQQYS